MTQAVGRGLARGAFVVLLCALTLLGDRTAQAATFTVTNTDDSGPGSLRQALIDAGNAPGADTINVSATGTVNLQSGLGIFTDMQVNGPGADKLTVRRDTGGDYPVLKVFDANATISGLKIANGKGAPGDVGGIGFIDNSGGHVLTLKAVTVTNNEGYGGGIYNSGTMNVVNSTINNNASVSGTSDTPGGGILNNGGTLTVTNSTFSTNTGSSGAGISNGGALTLTNVTIFGNVAPVAANLANATITATTSLKNTMPTPRAEATTAREA